MNKNICTRFDSHMRSYCSTNVGMSWTMELQNGVTVYGDYDRPGYEKCWDRVKNYCGQEKVLPVNVKLFMMGVPEFTFFEDPNGLNGLSICRGAAMEQRMSGGNRSFQFLSVSYLRDECDYVDVRKFVWPFNDFEEGQAYRKLTRNNIQPMIFNHESEKFKRQEIQEYYYGTTV